MMILGERLIFNISSPFTLIFGSKRHLLPIVDEISNFIWSFFLKEKSDLVDMIGLIKHLKNKCNLQVQYFHCNNTGENVSFKKACKQEWLGVDFKYIAPGVPQKNGHVKENLFPFSTRYMLCSTAVNSMLTFKMVYRLKLQTWPCFLRTTY